MKRAEEVTLEKLDACRWRVRKEGSMRVDGIVYADDAMMETIRKDKSLVQVANVAELPGIVRYSLAMPDIHWGYGFPIGGVAAFDPDEGVISPGGVGYDINCGVRLIRSDLQRGDVAKKIKPLLNGLFHNIPCGVGSRRKDLRLGHKDFRKVMVRGARWAVGKGFGWEEDLRHIEEGGALPGADPEEVSHKAEKRGHDQVGTLGSGNHFVEIGYIAEVYDEKLAEALGLFKNQVSVIVHTGSRGFGHQVCDDYIKVMDKAARHYGIQLSDRQLCCAPVRSDEGRRYLAAMACAVNFAFTNRQLITHWVRETFAEVFGKAPEKLGLRLVYDVCHNIAKMEVHRVGGEERELCVHRKGATRAFPPGHPKVPEDYRAVGQPVLIPGDMGTCSYVLVGTEKAYEETFGSTCHGAGRTMSRHAAKRLVGRRKIDKELKSKGILVRASSWRTLVEEVPEAYKDVSHVVNVVHEAGISRKVAQHRPLAVIKG
jgi:tRNA-splicing ligase RtcB